MSEPDDAVEAMVLRSVTISEVMQPTGELDITYNTEGDPELWTVLGLLEVGLIAVRNDIGALWGNAAHSDDD